MGREELVLKREGRQGDDLARNTALVSAAVILVISWCIVLSNNPTKAGWFALHPLLQTLAIFLFTYGILTLQPTSQPKTKAAGLVRHQAAIIMTGFPAILVGTFAVVYHKFLEGANHLVTWHAVFGLISMVWIFLQIFLGAGSVWFDGIAFGGGAKAKTVWKYHRLSGYILFPLLLATVHLGGGWSRWGEKYSNWGFRIVAYTIAPLAILGSIYVRVRTSKMKFF